MEKTRRNFIIGGAAIFGTAGAALGLSHISSNYELEKRYVTSGLNRPVIKGGPTPSEGALFDVGLITTKEEEEKKFNTSVLPETRQKSWPGTNFNSEFISYLISREPITIGGAVSGDKPRSGVHNGVFQFELKASELEMTPGNSSNLYQVIERWSYSDSPPEEIQLVVNY